MLEENRIKALIHTVTQRLENQEDSLSFSLLDNGITLFTDNTELKEWLKDYFESYFDWSVGDIHRTKIYNSYDYSDYLAVSDIFPTLRDEQFNDVGVYVYEVNGNFNIVVKRYIDQLDCVYSYCILSRMERTILMLNAEKNIQTNYFVMRLLRSCISFLLAEKGYLHFHAACLDKGGIGIGIIGDRFAGKTTNMINILSQEGYRFIANDKIALLPQDKQVLVLGYPISVGIRVGTIFSFDRVKTWFNNDETMKEKISKYNNYTFYELKNIDDKKYISPKQLCSIFNTSIASKSSMNILIVPYYNEDSDKAELVALSRDELKEYLKNNILTEICMEEMFLDLVFEIDYGTIELGLEKIVNADWIEGYKLIQNKNTLSQALNIVDKKVKACDGTPTRICY